MHVEWMFTGCDASDQERVTELWRQQNLQLEAKIESAGGNDSTPLCLAVEHSDAAPQWVSRAALYLPRGVAASEFQGEQLEETLGEVVHDLAGQIDQRLDQPTSAGVRREGLHAVVPFLSGWHERGRSREFITMLTPVLQAFSPYVAFELQARSGPDEAHSGQATARDILDETLVRAWDEFDRRPAHQALDVWLVHLIDAVIEDLSRADSERSLQERIPLDEVDSTNLVRGHAGIDATESDTIALGEVLADRERLPVGVEPWERGERRIDPAELDAVVARLPRPQRQSVLLRAVGGFTVAEIADFQNRSPADVEEDWATAEAEARRDVRPR